MGIFLLKYTILTECAKYNLKQYEGFMSLWAKSPPEGQRTGLNKGVKNMKERTEKPTKNTYNSITLVGE